ncbi:LAETG motif-containing sortase-dependent surface protein [Streptomyces sp. NPDC002490]|uniref:LAETG motif-containing sortase-dependent surface protein n=1 Tax=Streptomyces sp. NPDC002490 TaxID=3154416 RepID=UPI0033349966
MKLRRAMVLATATAALAPVVLLSAPVAVATEPDTSTSAEASTSPSPSPSTDGDASSTPSTDASTTPSVAASTSTTPSGTAEKPGEADAAEGDEATESASAPASSSAPPSTPSAPSPDATDGEDGEPQNPDELPWCGLLDDERGDEDPGLTTEVSGLPGRIVAGSGWHEFTMTSTNTSEATLNDVAFYAEVENFEIDDVNEFLSPYASLQYFDPEDGRWREIRGTEEFETDVVIEWAGGYFTGVETMKPQDYLTSKLRLSIRKDAPVGDGYAFGSGGYVDAVNGEACVVDGLGSDLYFTVLAPGSSNEEPGEAGPGEGTARPGPGKGPGEGTGSRPQGGVDQQPITGNLAATGSSSALPTIGAIGGVAVLAGAGALLYVRRRKAADTRA